MNSAILSHLAAFNDPREGIREFAARKLACYGAEAAPLLIELLAEQGGYSQECAALALQEMGPPAIPFLVAALQHENKKTRWQAAVILAAMGEPAHQAVRESKRLKLDQNLAAS